MCGGGGASDELLDLDEVTTPVAGDAPWDTPGAPPLRASRSVRSILAFTYSPYLDAHEGDCCSRCGHIITPPLR